ncbi:MAG: transglutaminase domain-containing protein [Thermoguttaceae bacterium]
MRRCGCLLVAILGLCAARPGLGQFSDTEPAKTKAGQTGKPALPPGGPAGAAPKSDPSPAEPAAGAAEGTPHAPSVPPPSSPQPVEPPAVADDQGKLRCQRGMVIRAVGGSFHAIVGTMAVPDNLPGEQQVRVVAEDIPPGASVRYRTLEGGTRQMAISLSSLAAGKQVRVAVTFEVAVLPAAPLPADLAEYTAPDPARLDRKLAPFLAPSPLIESNRAEVTRLAAEITADQKTALEKIKAIHAWVYENIKFELPADPRELSEVGRQGVLETIKKRSGVCTGKNSAAVGLLRAAKIPARLVRVASSASYEHCYYEFCLLDGEGHPAWIAADASATAQLQPRIGSRGAVILQKGDNVLVPSPRGTSRVRQRFLETTLSGLPNTPGAKLELKMIGQ